MPNHFKTAAIRTSKFVSDHKVAITAITTATVTTALFVKVIRGAEADVNGFLEEEGLLEKFHARFDIPLDI